MSIVINGRMTIINYWEDYYLFFNTKEVRNDQVCKYEQSFECVDLFCWFFLGEGGGAYTFRYIDFVSKIKVLFKMNALCNPFVICYVHPY